MKEIEENRISVLIAQRKTTKSKYLSFEIKRDGLLKENCCDSNNHKEYKKKLCLKLMRKFWQKRFIAVKNMGVWVPKVAIIASISKL
jgi:hypothetical protein